LFEKIYYSKKKADVETNVKKFYDTLSNAKDQLEVVEAMKQYEDNYNTFMAIVDLDSNITITFKTGFERLDAQKNTMIKDLVNEIRYNDSLKEELNQRGKVTFGATQPGATTKSLVSIKMDKSKIIIGVTSLQYISEAVDVIEIFYEYLLNDYIDSYKTRNYFTIRFRRTF